MPRDVDSGGWEVSVTNRSCDDKRELWKGVAGDGPGTGVGPGPGSALINFQVSGAWRKRRQEAAGRKPLDPHKARFGAWPTLS